MEEDKYNANEDLSGVFECKLGDFVKSKLNENGKANFEKIKDGLSQNDELEVLVGLLGKLDENGSLVFSEIINKVNDDGAGSLYLLLSKISVAAKSDVKKPYAVKFASLLNSFNEAGAGSFCFGVRE